MRYPAYLALEASSQTKHEHVHGEVFAMPGGTIAHGALITGIGAALSDLLSTAPQNWGTG